MNLRIISSVVFGFSSSDDAFADDDDACADDDAFADDDACADDDAFADDDVGAGGAFGFADDDVFGFADDDAGAGGAFGFADDDAGAGACSGDTFGCACACFLRSFFETFPTRCCSFEGCLLNNAIILLKFIYWTLFN